MDEKDPQPESFEDFKNSFSYGSRTDLNFKFLKLMQDSEAAGFIQDLFQKLGEAIDDGGFAGSGICERRTGALLNAI